MKAHGFDMRGTFKGERVPTLPSQGSAFGNEGREIYVEDESKRYYSDGSSWVDYSIAESATQTEANILDWPFENQLEDNGRFAGTAAGINTTLNDVTDPFTNSSFFAPFNSANVTQAGKFIYNNNDYGGSAGAMTQTTIDLIDTIGRTSNDARYGSEFRIAGIAAGSGTSAGATFPGGTRYLMTATASVILGFSGYVTFAGWVRAINGTIGIGASYFTYFSIDGVEQDTTHYDLTTAAGWIFIIGMYNNGRGYDSGFPRFYGNNGNTLQVALPALFNGYVLPQPIPCPIISYV